MAGRGDHGPADTTRRHRAAFVATAVVLVIVAAGCAGGLGGSSAEVPCPSAIEAPVLSPGDTWTFRYEDGTQDGQRYDAVTEDGLLRGRGPRRDAEYYYDHTHTLRKVFHNGRWLTQETRDFPAIGQSDLDFPLVVGKTWPLTLRDRSFALPFVGYTRVVVCEQITVPAGSFLAVRIDVDGSVVGVPGVTLSWRYWYAPAVKYWVKHTEAPTSLRTRRGGFELESFTIDAGKPATP